jgi:gliding motility-associated-like protein
MKQLLVVLFLGVRVLNAQFFLDSAAVLSMKSGSILFINDSLNIERGARLDNDGQLIINGSVNNNGLIFQNNEITLNSHLRNFGQIVASIESQTRFYGQSQSVFSDSTLVLGQVALSGGNKLIFTDIEADKSFITGAIVFCDSNSFSIGNPAAQALIAVNAWFVFERSGALYRKVHSDSVYQFPVGSSSLLANVYVAPASDGFPGLRYCPQGVTEEGASTALIAPQICTLAESMAYRFYRLPLASDILLTKVGGFIAADSLWCVAGLIPQQTSFVPVNVNLNFGNTDSTSLTLNYSGNTDFMITQYLKRPEPLEIFGPDSLCKGFNEVEYTTNSNPNEALLWSVSGGALNQSATATSVPVTWINQQEGALTLIRTDVNGCSSLPSTLLVSFLPVPTANFSIDAPNYFHTEEPFVFTDESEGAVLRGWTFSDNTAGNEIQEIKRFDAPGEYEVVLIVQNQWGCSDTLSRSVTIFEDVIFPDVFTPNNDGVNDVLEIKLSGIQLYSLQIYDRWGTLQFETTKQEHFWDGTSIHGAASPSGIYFAVLKAATTNNIYDTRKAITLLR